MNVFPLRLPKEIKEPLRLKAFVSNVSLNKLIIKILADYLKDKAA